MGHWPWPALVVWVVAWSVHFYAKAQGWGLTWALVLPFSVGAWASVWAARRGQSRARQALLLVGFPLSWFLLASPAVPAWAWLLPLGALLGLYPLRSWRDAPVFPTPLNALRVLSAHAPLAAGARVLDAGCGAGDGLRALRRVYPDALLSGVELSRVLSWVARWRCPWARVKQADMWLLDWSSYELVYLFQRPESMERAGRKAQQELPPGAWLVSLEFPVPGLLPELNSPVEGERHVWLYQAPFVRLGEGVGL
jgi:SAM-dependent methyltransferase